MDLDAFRWLLTDAGAALLARVAELVPADGPRRADELAVQTELRRHAAPEHVAAAIGQVELRRHAEAKFGDAAARMWFTRDGLEQATRASVAAHRAGRLAAFRADSLVDLGCGIGGDLVAAAKVGVTCVGVDLDPLRVAVAEANLAALECGGAVAVADATEVDTGPFAVAFADPARRTGAGRTFDVDEWSPPWPFVERLLTRDSCVKVAPGIPHSLVPDGVEAEWVSDHGEVKEAALWSGGLATTARRATVIGDGGLATLTEDDDPGAEVRDVGDVPLRARRRRDPRRAGHRGRRRGRRRAGRRPHRLRHLRQPRSARRSPAATACASSCPTARSSSRPPCASAASAG